MTFDKISQEKFLYDFNDAIVEFVDLKIVDIARQLRVGECTLKEDRLSIELGECVLRIQMKWSSFNPNICNNMEITKINKGRCYNVKQIDKKFEFYLCSDLYTIKLVA